MDAKTEAALLDGIAKWRANARAETPGDVRMGKRNCPLCRMYHPNLGGQGDCQGCPVSARTGRPYCQGSPYNDAVSAHFRWLPDDANAAERAAATTAAQDMADFLTDLLPEASQ